MFKENFSWYFFMTNSNSKTSSCKLIKSTLIKSSGIVKENQYLLTITINDKFGNLPIDWFYVFKLSKVKG